MLLEEPRLPREFVCAARAVGMRADPTQPDLALFHSRAAATAAGLLTRNHFPGAPILLARERLAAGRLRTVVVNARVSNVATGEAGLRDAREMAELAAVETGVSPAEVLVGSTGIIGRRLPMDRIREGLRGMARELDSDPWPAARAIMTTDTHPKVVTAEVDGATLTAVGKGAGMVSPNLATMLVYLFTDAHLSAPALDRMLRRAAATSFQILSIDTDTSTSDMVVALANGVAGAVPEESFQAALDQVCLRMAELVARDGEGATKLLRVSVSGAIDHDEAHRIARSVADSPLVKTMAYGADPNVGRLLMAVGKCVTCRVVPDRVRITLQGVEVIRDGMPVDFPEDRVRELLGGDPVEIRVELRLGSGRGAALGCDLTEGYVEENAAYASS